MFCELNWVCGGMQKKRKRECVCVCWSKRCRKNTHLSFPQVNYLTFPISCGFGQKCSVSLTTLKSLQWPLLCACSNLLVKYTVIIGQGEEV